jgi:hypothetical protein
MLSCVPGWQDGVNQCACKSPIKVADFKIGKRNFQNCGPVLGGLEKVPHPFGPIRTPGVPTVDDGTSPQFWKFRFSPITYRERYG